MANQLRRHPELAKPDNQEEIMTISDLYEELPTTELADIAAMTDNHNEMVICDQIIRYRLNWAQ